MNQAASTHSRRQKLKMQITYCRGIFARQLRDGPAQPPPPVRADVVGFCLLPHSPRRQSALQGSTSRNERRDRGGRRAQCKTGSPGLPPRGSARARDKASLKTGALHGFLATRQHHLLQERERAPLGAHSKGNQLSQLGCQLRTLLQVELDSRGECEVSRSHSLLRWHYRER